MNCVGFELVCDNNSVMNYFEIFYFIGVQVLNQIKI